MKILRFVEALFVLPAILLLAIIALVYFGIFKLIDIVVGFFHPHRKGIEEDKLQNLIGESQKCFGDTDT